MSQGQQYSACLEEALTLRFRVKLTQGKLWGLGLRYSNHSVRYWYIEGLSLGIATVVIRVRMALGSTNGRFFKIRLSPNYADPPKPQTHLKRVELRAQFEKNVSNDPP